MKRIGKRIAGSIAVLVAMSVSTGTASAQEQDHPTATTSPVVSVDPPFVASGSFAPGTRQHLGIAAAAIEQGRRYRGTLDSRPFPPPATMPASDGAMLWTDVLIPTDFELGADHRMTVVDDVTDVVVAETDFHVDLDGTVHAFAPVDPGSAPAGGPERGAGSTSGASGRSSGEGWLARTASDTDVPAKLGVGLLALAALAVLTVHTRHDERMRSS
jgi:hypothetical protein